MRTLEDVQLAIAVLPVREWLEINRWVARLAGASFDGVSESEPAYGASPDLVALRSAIERLDATELLELREWLQPLFDEPSDYPVDREKPNRPNR